MLQETNQIGTRTRQDSEDFKRRLKKELVNRDGHKYVVFNDIVLFILFSILFQFKKVLVNFHFYLVQLMVFGNNIIEKIHFMYNIIFI